MNWMAWAGVVVTLLAAVALVLYREKARRSAFATAQFVSEVKAEVLKITWPTRESARLGSIHTPTPIRFVPTLRGLIPKAGCASSSRTSRRFWARLVPLRPTPIWRTRLIRL